MMKLSLAVFAVFSILPAAWAAEATSGLMGHWAFDGTLSDASGLGHHATGDGASFKPGKRGEALASEGKQVQVASSPDIMLSPGIVIDCWVYFEKPPKAHEVLVFKDREYQLRVDSPEEGGHFAFFVYLDAWEPRIWGPIPKPKQWHHLVASWSGAEMSLEVDGDRSSTNRSGLPVPTGNPLLVGNSTGRMDELRIFNPVVESTRQMRRLVEKTIAGNRIEEGTFGGVNGWKEWKGLGQTNLLVRKGVLTATLPATRSLVVNANLSIDVTSCKWVSLSLDAGTARNANLTFITERGEGMVTFPVWGGRRASLVNLAPNPMWSGKLRLLALSFTDGLRRNLSLRELRISKEPAGNPFLYVRSFAPARAILRTGREEGVLAVVRNLGSAAKHVTATLELPGSVHLTRGSRQLAEGSRSQSSALGYEGTGLFEWKVRADRPMKGKARVVVTADKSEPVQAELPLEFTSPSKITHADYVPPPKPVRPKYLTLMHYCPLWKEGTHYGWGRIEPWPERRPAIGWYDEGTPEVADWHIKYALEHGIQGFIYCWYRANFGPDVQQIIGHAVHDGLLKAKYLNQFKFCILWENANAKGVQSREDMLDNLLPFWMKNYFKHPSYVKVDNKPLLLILAPSRVTPELGGSAGVRKVFGEMREVCRGERFDGLYIIGCVERADRILQQRMAEEGYDATCAYGLWGRSTKPPGRDVEGITTIDHHQSLLAQKEIWREKKAIGAIPDIVDVMVGWDPRPWHLKQTHSYLTPATPANFEAACRQARALLEATPGNGLDKRVIVFDNWNEFGEGHYIEPCSGNGFGYVDAIKRVFCDNPPPCEHVIPEDVGLQNPERVYLTRRAILGGFPERERIPVDNLVAWWRFDGDDEFVARDSSNCRFHAVKQGFQTTEGIIGKGFLCSGGSVAVGPNRLFWPVEGITVELWMKTQTAGQSDRWLVNTIGAANNGYRLGFDKGRIAWQIPQTPWSHLLVSPEPAALGQWIHVAATCDNKTMRIYIDGVEKASMERLGAIVPSEATLCLGTYTPGHPFAFFQGVMDEVRIYNRALAGEEVARRARENRP